MTGERIPQSVLAVAAGLLIFGGLLGARWLMHPAERGQISVQSAYDELGDALGQAGILPLRGEDALLLGYANVVVSLSQLNEPQVGGAVTTVALGMVLSGAAADGTVYELRVRPQQWRDLRPGAPRTALRKLSHIPLSKQSLASAQAASAPGGASAAPPQNFDFTISVAGQLYRCVPYFSGERLDEILIKPAA